MPPRYRSSFSGSQLGTTYHELWTPPPTRFIKMSRTMCHLDIRAHFLAPDLGPLAHRIGIVAPKFQRCSKKNAGNVKKRPIYAKRLLGPLPHRIGIVAPKYAGNIKKRPIYAKWLFHTCDGKKMSKETCKRGLHIRNVTCQKILSSPPSVVNPKSMTR